MAKKKTTRVHKHPRHVPVSQKNPNGITIVEEHFRRLPGTSLDKEELSSIFKNYSHNGLKYPSKGKLPYPNANKYDDLIAVWTDYFNKKFDRGQPIDPDVIKALLGSESAFQLDPQNPMAIGIAQITRDTLKILQDPNGETKDFLFNKINQKDLKDPSVAIPLAIRWIARKRDLAANKLKRNPTAEEIILEYKGLLKSKTQYKNHALQKFREDYEKLKKK